MTERTTFFGGIWIEGQGDAVAEVAPEPVDGFASAWHRQRFVDDLGRELADVEQKLAAVGLHTEWLQVSTRTTRPPSRPRSGA
jgi:hypothetical protein